MLDMLKFNPIEKWEKAMSQKLHLVVGLVFKKVCSFCVE